MKQDIKGLTFSALKADLLTLGFKPYTAKQIFDWLYEKRVDSFRKMSNISGKDISLLEERFYIANLNLLERLESKDGTEKFLFELSDRQTIETVFIPKNNRNTVCLSSQVGCKFGCLFCASGSNFVRDLTISEITSQLSEVMNITKKVATHLVFMGIGEALDNYNNVLKAIHILNSHVGFNIGARRITVSTCGIIPAIERLKDEGLQIELSISLHTADNNLRTELMPINRKYPLKELLVCVRDYIKRTNRQITFEYVLMEGLNDGLPDADKLSETLAGLNCKVNLILCNTVETRPARDNPSKADVLLKALISNGSNEFKPPTNKDALNFKNRLIKNGIHATLRISRGQDIRAACGQLRIRPFL